MLLFLFNKLFASVMSIIKVNIVNILRVIIVNEDVNSCVICNKVYRIQLSNFVIPDFKTACFLFYNNVAITVCNSQNFSDLLRWFIPESLSFAE